MPEANVLYTVTAVVVAALVIWVAFVLKTAKEPWARAVASAPAGLGDDVPAVPTDEANVAPESDPAVVESAKAGPEIDADSTARATPLALANKAKSTAKVDES
jgi:hypothetical protein